MDQFQSYTPPTTLPQQGFTGAFSRDAFKTKGWRFDYWRPVLRLRKSARIWDTMQSVQLFIIGL